MRAVARCRAILVVGLIACRVIPEQEEGRVDTASAHADTQTIDLAAPPRQPAAIADALTSLDNGDSIRRDTTNPPIPQDAELSALAKTLTIPPSTIASAIAKKKVAVNSSA